HQLAHLDQLPRTQTMDVALDPFLLVFGQLDETHPVLGHRSGEFRAQHQSFDLQGAGISWKIKVQSDDSISRQHAIDLEEHPARRDVETTAKNEAAVFLERDFDLRDRAQLTA